jgi:WD40 repeat protein
VLTPQTQIQSEVALYRGPTTPVTCLAIGGKDGQSVFAGSWDKYVWSWDILSAKQGVKFAGHSDFVKAVICTKISGLECLISGGADKKIILWDAITGSRLQTMQDPMTTMMAVQHLAIDPFLSTEGEVLLVSASSDPNIRRWRITRDRYEQLPEEHTDQPSAERSTIQEHETSVYKLLFDTDGEDIDLFTASADGTAKCLSRVGKFTAEDVYEHGDYVRAVVVSDHWVITGGRDENVKVWDRSSAELYCTLEGHYDEVTDLVLLKSGTAGKPDVVCSVSIDGTIRTWPVEKGELDKVIMEIRNESKPSETGEVKDEKESLLSPEEEAELAALMDDD